MYLKKSVKKKCCHTLLHLNHNILRARCQRFFFKWFLLKYFLFQPSKYTQCFCEKKYKAVIKTKLYLSSLSIDHTTEQCYFCSGHYSCQSEIPLLHHGHSMLNSGAPCWLHCFTLALTSKNYFIDNLVVWSFTSLTISASVQMYIFTKSCILYLICRLLLTSYMVYLHSTYFLHIKCVESYYRYNENLTWTFRTHAKNIALPWCPKVNRSKLLGMRLNDDF